MSTSYKRGANLRCILGIVCLFTSAVSIACFSHDVFAGITGANGNKPPASTQCGGLTGRPTFCGEFGVSWRYYTLNQVSSIANYSGPAKTCDDEGVEGIWILAYEWVNGDGSFQGKQVLDRSDKNVHVSQVQPIGWYKFVAPENLPDGGVGVPKTMQEAKEQFDYYKSAFSGNTSWNDTTWFCGNEDLEPKKGIITAESGISVDGVEGERTGAKIGPKSTGFGKDNTIGGSGVTVSTSQSSISGKIWHNLYYDNTDPNWASIKAKDKKYDFSLDTLWCTADGDQTLPKTACDISGSGTSGMWSVAASKGSDSKSKVGEKSYRLTPGQSYCQTLSPDPLKFKFNAITKDKDPDIDESGTGNTTACISVNHVDKPENPSDEFWSTSSVEVPESTSQLGYETGGKHTSDRDAAVGLKVSTDNSSLKFTLSHNMNFDIADYWNNIWHYWGCVKQCSCWFPPCGCCKNDWIYRGESTNLSYELTGETWETGESSKSTIDTGKIAEISKTEQSEYKAGKDKDTENQNEEVATYTYTISDMEPGKTYKVCHKIKYSPKGYTIPITEQLGWTGPWTIGPDWVYGVPEANSGSGDSESCIEITRPKDPPEGCPDDDPTCQPYGPKNSGSSNADVMFAGEIMSIAKTIPS